MNRRRGKMGEKLETGVVGQKAGLVIQTSGRARSEACELFLAGQSPAECSIISIRTLYFRGIQNGAGFIANSG